MLICLLNAESCKSPERAH
ncbi:hypothetical protein TFKS16_1438 [Tannerella forsythia KS16]|nr:hypothetical protein TFKS16_1438 [Tannerella forsythia KS16]